MSDANSYPGLAIGREKLLHPRPVSERAIFATGITYPNNRLAGLASAETALLREFSPSARLRAVARQKDE